jgi:hypothetical protein
MAIVPRINGMITSFGNFHQNFAKYLPIFNTRWFDFDVANKTAVPTLKIFIHFANSFAKFGSQIFLRPPRTTFYTTGALDIHK